LNNIKDFTKGWFIGNFEPSLIKTNDVEVAYKEYKAGDKEAKHFHKIATEITVIISGEVSMNDVLFTTGDVITTKPGEVVEFKCLADTKTMVVKYPGASDDKYEAEQ
jgi:quercetin dioxygenase-like cupin family protein